MGKVNFETALQAVKQGKLITREIWSYKYKFVFMRPADNIPVQTVINQVKSLLQAVKDFYSDKYGTESAYSSGNVISVHFDAYLCLKDPNDKIINGWTPSPEDVFTEDWIILD